jgi:hypothetical protein
VQDDERHARAAAAQRVREGDGVGGVRRRGDDGGVGELRHFDISEFDRVFDLLTAALRSGAVFRWPRGLLIRRDGLETVSVRLSARSLLNR